MKLRFLPAIFVSLLVSTTVAAEAEYESVSSVMEHLSSQDGVRIRTEQGWTIAEDPGEMALYTFTTEGHAAHPAVFMRKVVESDGAVLLRTWGICEAEESACNELSDEFEALNELIRQDMNR